MKFINKIVNGGFTLILFVTNLVYIPLFFMVKGASKHIRTFEWKWKRDGTLRSLAQKGVDLYHLDLAGTSITLA